MWGENAGVYGEVEAVKMIESLMEKIKASNEKLAWIIYFLLLLPIVSVLISSIIANDNEGYISVYFSIMYFLTISIFGILGLAFGVMGLFGSNENITPLVGLGLMLILLTVVIFYFPKSKNKVYNAIFENKITVVTDNYGLWDIPSSRSPTEYYLYIGENGKDDIGKTDDRVSINEKTYRQLMIKKESILTITYQPKAEILYDLQISTK